MIPTLTAATLSPKRSSGTTLRSARSRNASARAPSPVHLARRPFDGGRGKHRVLAGHPPATGSPQPSRRFLGHGGGYQDARAAHREQHGSGGPLLEAELPRDRSQGVGSAPVRPRHRVTVIPRP